MLSAVIAFRQDYRVLQLSHLGSCFRSLCLEDSRFSAFACMYAENQILHVVFGFQHTCMHVMDKQLFYTPTQLKQIHAAKACAFVWILTYLGNTKREIWTLGCCLEVLHAHFLTKSLLGLFTTFFQNVLESNPSDRKFPHGLNFMTFTRKPAKHVQKRVRRTGNPPHLQLGCPL